MFPNNLYTHLIACDAASSYHCLYPITVSKIPKWDCIMNFCSGCSSMNSTYLESAEQLGSFFPASLHKLKSIYFKTYLNVRYTY